MGENRRNELRKHVASWLNTLGALIISVGAITPIIALLLGVQSPESGTIIQVILLSLFAGVAFHLLGRFVLSGYEE